MNKALRDQVLELPADEKLELVMEVWDSLDEADLPPPTDAQIVEAERRLEAYKRDPSRGAPADVVMRRIRARFE